LEIYFFLSLGDPIALGTFGSNTMNPNNTTPDGAIAHDGSSGFQNKEADSELRERKATPPNDVESVEEKLEARAGGKKTTWTNWALWEFGALLLCGIIIGGMAGFLKRYDGRPAPTWSFHFKDADPPWLRANRITFNAILSIFSKAASLCLLYAMSQAMAKLTWIWFFGEKDRKLADLDLFYEVAQKSTSSSLKLLWSSKLK
jgi:Protein of unknown function (DUF3176)